MKKLNIMNHWKQTAISIVSLLSLTLMMSSATNAASTQIATAPIFTGSVASTLVKPNVMFVMDDSGSMGWRLMPDEAWDFANRKGEIASQCNGVYYDPTVTYLPPLNADGSSFPDSSFTAAPINGFDTNSPTRNLNNQFGGWYYYSDTSAANYYVYSGTQTTPEQKTYRDANSTFYQECDQARSTNSPVWTNVIVSATSGIGGTDERINFANWFTYYRTRMLMMKSSTGRAFNQLGDTFRIGYSTLNNASSTSDFLNISDYNATHKQAWYDKFYAANPSGGTPLRESLAEAGLVFSGRATSINGTAVTDPVQYACQQNYTILSTDGYWNGNAGFKIDGSAIGNEDGLLSTPYNDGTDFVKEIVTTYTTVKDVETIASGFTITDTLEQVTNSSDGPCTIPSTLTPPPNTATANLQVKNNRVAALTYSTTNPGVTFFGTGGRRCKSLGGNVWFCRSGGFGAGSAPAGGADQSSVTGDDGETWYLVSDGATGNSNCLAARDDDAWGNAYYLGPGACKATGVPERTGQILLVETETATRDTLDAETSEIERFTAVQTTTQGPVTPTSQGVLGPLTPATLNFVSNGLVSNSSTPGVQQGVSGFSGPPAVNMGCVADADLPPMGPQPAVVVSTVQTGGTSTQNEVSNTSTTVAETVNSQTGGTSNTLADVAAYYYNTNLREWDGTGAMPGYCVGPVPPGETEPTNLCAADLVPVNGNDNETSQHMTTFTLGLGAQGNMTFIPDYETNTAGDYYFVEQGLTKTSTTCSWQDAMTQPGGRCNWPVPVANTRTTIDDLWHAAINGHGNYFNATNAEELAAALSSSLNTIVNAPLPGTAAASTTASPRITSENNFQFSTYFKSVEWSGDVIRQTINLASRKVPDYDHLNPDPSAYDWSAHSELESKGFASRNIYTKSDSGNTLVAFTWANLSANQKQFFQAPHVTTAPPTFPAALTGLSQFCVSGASCLDAVIQGNGSALGQPLVNFLRGDRSNEEVGDTASATKFYRQRESKLGDIVSAQPQYAGPPNRRYSDTGYAAFKAANANRTAIVYAAANDGMVHAFNAETGEEAWAYIPSFVLPRLYTLADKNYANKHQYFVEGTPVVEDVYIGDEWKTILVGGLNAGGVGYYALDVTNPASPEVLWEFTDANVGYSFGNPNITKLDDGTWVVLLSSGYNNCPSTTTGCVKNGQGDGEGHLYVLSAETGSLVALTSDVTTEEGSATAPSGLTKIVALGRAANRTSRVYGGDLFGNLWRFNISASGYSKQRLATLKDSLGNAQPITTRPIPTSVSGKTVIYVGTGRYLGTDDVDFTLRQTFYAIKDTDVDYGNPRSAANAGNFISRVAQASICPSSAPIDVCEPGSVIRTSSAVTGADDNETIRDKNGWYVDFPVGEIAFTDARLVSGTLIFSTSSPTASSDVVCGASTGDDSASFAYMLNYLNGGSAGSVVVVLPNGQTVTVLATKLGNGLASSPLITEHNGEIRAEFNLSDGSKRGTTPPSSLGGSGASRTSWREFIND